MITDAELARMILPPELPENCGHNEGHRPGVCRDCRDEIETKADKDARQSVAKLVAELRRVRGVIPAVVYAAWLAGERSVNGANVFRDSEAEVKRLVGDAGVPLWTICR